MKKEIGLCIGVIFSILLFILALVVFNDTSFILLGMGIMILGVVALIKINERK